MLCVWPGEWGHCEHKPPPSPKPAEPSGPHRSSEAPQRSPCPPPATQGSPSGLSAEERGQGHLAFLRRGRLPLPITHTHTHTYTHTHTPCSSWLDQKKEQS